MKAEDADDLYADLYGGDEVAGGNDHEDGDKSQDKGQEEPDLIRYEEDSKDVRPSFIPPASTTAKTSFIPPPASSAHVESGSNRDELQPTSSRQEPDQPSNQGYGNGKDSDHSQQKAESQGQDTLNAAGSNDDQNRPVMPHEMPEEGKMFVGGLNWDTTQESLRNYFSQFGKIGHCTIMRDNLTGRSRGFAFLTFVDPKAVNTVMVREHYLDGKVIDPKRAIPRPEQARNQKLFVGGLPQTITSESFRTFFQQFGTVVDCTCMMDKDTGKPRGFGFVTFQDDSSVEYILNLHPVLLEGKQIDIKRAQSKNDPVSLQQNRVRAGGFQQTNYNHPQQQQQEQQPQQNPYYRQDGLSYESGRTSGGREMFGSTGSAAAGMMNGMMNPMMTGMGMMGGAAASPGNGTTIPGTTGGFDPQTMSRMYQQMAWGSANWNPQMAWQQMMNTMAPNNLDVTAGMAINMGAGMPMSINPVTDFAINPTGPRTRHSHPNRRDSATNNPIRLPNRPSTQPRDHSRERSPPPPPTSSSSSSSNRISRDENRSSSFRRERSQRSERYHERQRY